MIRQPKSDKQGPVGPKHHFEYDEKTGRLGAMLGREAISWNAL